MKFEENNSGSLSDVYAVFVSSLSRYWRVSWAPALVLMSLILVLSVRLPDYYVSDVLILAQPQKIQSDVIKAGEKEEQQERLEVLLQELLSRPRLRSIIEQFNLYPEYQGFAGKEMALDHFRSAVTVTPSQSPSGRVVSTTFRVEFLHVDPDVAHEVTKKLANLFIEESIINRRSETQGTEEFLEAQLRDARKQLEETEARVQGFVRQNVGKLPEHREQALGRLRTMQEQLRTNSQMIAANMSRLGYLQSELKLAQRAETASAMVDEPGAASDPETSLAQLERALVVLRSRYSERHPDVVNTQKRIEMLKSRVAAQAGSTGGDSASRTAAIVGGNPEVRAIRREISETQVQIEALTQENAGLKKEVGQLNKDIKDMPIKDQELIKISRDYANVKENYERLLAAKSDATLQSSLVKSQKDTQFKVLDPPSRPVFPAGPPRIIIAAVGVLAGLALFFAIPVGLFFLNGGFKFREEVEDELEIAVIGIVPPMATPQAKKLQRRAGATTFVASVLSFFAGSVIIFLVV